MKALALMKMGGILLTGASGNLGSHVLKSGSFGKIIAPSHSEMDITNSESVDKFFAENDFNAVIHCAAMARVGECEKEPEKAALVNITGTANLVAATARKEAETGRGIRFIHISTDGVYQSTKGGYSEKDETRPYNLYGWTKLGGETAVNALDDFCIIRTRFFDPENIKHDTYATDSYTSIIPVKELTKAIAFMLESNFVGTVNIGGSRVSDYYAFRKYKPSIRECKIAEIQERTPFRLSKDASMNTSLWNRIKTS